MRRPGLSGRGPLVLALGAFAAILGAVVWAAMARTGGGFVYAMDDPYIHLALAREIAHGHYGLNAGEAAAPASSILWPFLLAPLARTGVAEALPFVLDVACGALTLGVLDRLFEREMRASAGLRGLLLLLAIPALNLVGSAMNGMEHGLQMLLTVAGLTGLVVRAGGKPVPRWAYAALVLGPFVRYENLALTIPALAYLFWSGERLGAARALGAVVVGLGAFSGFLLASGLGPMPSSVLVKQAAASRGLIGGVAFRLEDTLTNPRGVLLLAGALALGASALAEARARSERGLATVGIALVAFYAVAGAYDYRYVAFASGAVGLLLVALHAPALVARWHAYPVRTGALASAAVLLLMAPHLFLIATAPLASQNIYEQQAQMARFVQTEWRRPVAVNDLGLVSWRRSGYVLDLWGLGSNEAIRLRRDGPSGAWMEGLARAHGVDLAMIYAPWFPLMPASWVRVGTMRVSAANVTLGGDTVSFYATRPGASARITQALRRFRPSLPSGVALSLDADTLPTR